MGEESERRAICFEKWIIAEFVLLMNISYIFRPYRPKGL